RRRALRAPLRRPREPDAAAARAPAAVGRAKGRRPREAPHTDKPARPERPLGRVARPRARLGRPRDLLRRLVQPLRHGRRPLRRRLRRPPSRGGARAARARRRRRGGRDPLLAPGTPLGRAGTPRARPARGGARSRGPLLASPLVGTRRGAVEDPSLPRRGRDARRLLLRLQRPGRLPARDRGAVSPFRPGARGGAADPLPPHDRDGPSCERPRHAGAAARGVPRSRRRPRPRLARPRPEPGRDARSARDAPRRRPARARARRAAADAPRALRRRVRSGGVNVLFVTTNYPRPSSPIDGIFVREHARAAAEVADVRVVHLLREPAARGLLALERIEGEEPPAWRVPYRRFGKPLAQLAFVAGPLVLARRLRRA